MLRHDDGAACYYWGERQKSSWNRFFWRWFFTLQQNDCATESRSKQAFRVMLLRKIELPKLVKERMNNLPLVRACHHVFSSRSDASRKIASKTRAVHANCISSFNFVPLTPAPPWQPPQDSWRESYASGLSVSSQGSATTSSFSTTSSIFLVSTFFLF